MAGKPIHLADLVRLAESLGSDVPFFLHGGTALGLGRGTEVYPLPDLPPSSGVSRCDRHSRLHRRRPTAALNRHRVDFAR